MATSPQEAFLKIFPVLQLPSAKVIYSVQMIRGIYEKSDDDGIRRISGCVFQ